jgi:peptidoglycan/LPS O-acetylase OafA/YrhL
MTPSDSVPSSTFHLGYQPALDGIRGFAVLWVIGFHYNLPFCGNGIFGVDLFFTLSGFLITILLLEEWVRAGTIGLIPFYIRRILRLYPALIILLIVLSSVAPRPYVFSTLFYFTNWIKALHFQPDSLYLDHTWSLSIEEQYYLLWPLILMALLKTKISTKLIIFIPLVMGLASALARIVVWNSIHDWFRVYMGTDLHVDGLLLGSAFGMMTFFGFLPDFSKMKRILSLITLITLLLTFWLLIATSLTLSFIPIFGNIGVSIGTIIIICRLINDPSRIVSKIFSFPPLVKIGVISYGLYLWHAPVGAIFDKANFPWPPLYTIGAKIFVTFLAAGASYFLIEKPILRLKNNLPAIKPAQRVYGG